VCPSRLSTGSLRDRGHDKVSKMKQPERRSEWSGSCTSAISTRGINRCRLAAKMAQPSSANRSKSWRQPARN
jgi:hypothetical protein